MKNVSNNKPFLLRVREAIILRVAFALALLAAPWGPAAAAAAREHAHCRTLTNCTQVQFPIDEYSYSYYINDLHVIVEFKDHEHFIVHCVDRGLAADERALPVLERNSSVRVRRVRFVGCAPPVGSYVAALAALGLRAPAELELADLPAAPRLARAHLAGLDVASLHISAVNMSAALCPEEEFLADVIDLRALTLRSVELGAAALCALPVSLRRLELSRAALPAAERRAPLGHWAARLRALRSLVLVEEGGGLGCCSLAERRTSLSVSEEDLTESRDSCLLHVSETETSGPAAPDPRLAPPPLGALPELVELSVYGAMAPPPPGWLRDSPLQRLTLRACGLTELPDRMFDDAVNLTYLDLSGNKLTKLQPGVFSGLGGLRSLDVSDNRLDAAALALALPALGGLRSLAAGDNPLGSLCGDSHVIRAKESSGLPWGLQRLELRNTSATRICSDWVEDSSLQHIGLEYNRIGNLTYADVAMVRRRGVLAGPVKLLLTNNLLPLEVRIERKDVEACRAATAPPQFQRVPVELSLGALACDCRHAGLRSALSECAALLVARGALCASPPAAPAGRPRSALTDYEPDELLCPYRDHCVPGCACGKRWRDNATVVRCASGRLLPADVRWPASAARWPLVLHAPGAGLRAVPRAELQELHAANNSIARLDTRDIPDTLQVLDVSYNRIAHISEAAALRLASPPASPHHHALRRVNLSGNPLVCECALYPALVHLKAAKVEDWSEMQCNDLRFVHVLAESDLCPSALLPVLAGLLSALLLLLLAAGLLLWQRPRIEQFLVDHECCLSCILPKAAADDPLKTHDVFVSYAYPDHALAARLVRQLDARGYSTVEHCRDWLPGPPVSEQIARSVLCARVTMLLVTDSYARSSWCMDEFRAAYAHALERGSARVLPVCCALRTKVPDDLHLYLLKNTYLSWNDSYFWKKLKCVLPEPCQPVELMDLVQGTELSAAPPAAWALPPARQELVPVAVPPSP